MRKWILTTLGAILLMGSLYFFYKAAWFLGGQDYLAGVLQIFVGLAVIKSGIELEKLAAVAGEYE